MKKDFASLHDAGEKLADFLESQDACSSATILAPIMPNGIPVALPIAERWRARIAPIYVERTDQGVRVMNAGELADQRSDAHVLVVDDGVETGTAAMAAGRALSSVPGISLGLAVPVCPRSVKVMLDTVYRTVHAPVMPMVPRSLRWHFEDFDTINDERAAQLYEAWQRAEE